MIQPSIRNRMTLAEVETNVGLQQALQQKRADVTSTIRDSRLLGRGGAGFPCGVKWNLAAAAQADHKYILCNADEGEPGTFKDRVILSEWPDLVFEGMTIAAYAVGSTEGIVYLRGEYTYLVKPLEACLAKRRQAGLLGNDIQGRPGFNFDIRVQLGSGAYVCGEETALIESLEGQRGEPRNRPPFPVNTGLNGKPTVVNNVETFAWAAAIMARGPEWFSGVGTQKSTGLKLFSISGDVARPGVYEFPMGITIRELLKEVGGTDAKAVQIGGASGRCVPAQLFDSTIAYEGVATGGSIIVFGAHRDMLRVAENFLEFFEDESCGQCTPCRVGNTKLLEGVRQLERGECSIRYLDELKRLGETMQLSAKCGLGQTSPNAFLSIVEHFEDEILGRTPARV
jgi:[NiFe] hydrogenase diaphorase moiety large subunit